MTVPSYTPDHPHTDPGDGRLECDRCGKYVWPAIHSCKGVPVTAQARARHAITPRPIDRLYTDEDVEVAAGGIAREWGYDSLAEVDSVPDTEGVQARNSAEAALRALAARGRLVPPGSEVREEFGVRFKRSDDGKTDDRAARDRDDALTWIAELERVRELDKAPHGWAWTIAHAPLRRLRIVTPWSPSVPDTEEGS